MRYRYDILSPFSRGFTLIELLVTITIISILASLTLAGLGLARQRAKADRTETTIRKIHEAALPHYERFANRSVPSPGFSLPGSPTLETLGKKGVALIAKRRMMTLELPDGWLDLLQQTAAGSPAWKVNTYQSGVSLRFYRLAKALADDNKLTTVTQTFGDAECLWLSVMQGGYADPGIIGHFREDEFGDIDADGQREFIDGWGRPIRFLRWAPGFTSRYQPPPAAGTPSHDAFDLAGVDPLAQKSLFPLIFSMGPDGEPDIVCRDQPALSGFSYPEVGYDPYFPIRPATGSQQYHLSFSIRGSAPLGLGQYTITPSNVVELGTFEPRVMRDNVVVSDDVHNHAMSR